MHNRKKKNYPQKSNSANQQEADGLDIGDGTDLRTFMESTQPINVERIAWCCAKYGITATELASKIHIKETVLQPFMSGQGSLSFAQLSRIADLFDKSVLFFLEPGPVDEEKVHTLALRMLNNQKSNLTPDIKFLIERVEKQREIYLSLREDRAEAGFPKFQLPDLPLHNLAEAAQGFKAMPENGTDKRLLAFKQTAIE